MELFSVSQVATVARVPDHLVRAWARDSGVKKVGNAFVWSIRDVERFAVDLEEDAGEMVGSVRQLARDQSALREERGYQDEDEADEESEVDNDSVEDEEDPDDDDPDDDDLDDDDPDGDDPDDDDPDDDEDDSDEEEDDPDEDDDEP